MSFWSNFVRKRERAAYVAVENTFSSFSGSGYNNATFRAAVDVIARHAAKLKAHSDDAHLENLLSCPNSFMTGYDVLYKFAGALYTHNNAFMLLIRENGRIMSIYNIIPSSIEFSLGIDGDLFLEFILDDGKTLKAPYSDVIHVRRHFLSDDLLGEKNAPLYALLDTASSLQQGISQAVKNGTSIRGILKFSSLVNPSDVKAEKDRFTRDYMSLSNAGGIAAVDQRYDFVPMKDSGYTVPHEQIDAVNREIYEYLGINAAIIEGAYTEDQFTAFYESVLEPFAIQLSQEFKLKTGHEVRFTAERLEFSSAQTKLKLLHEAAPLGLLTVNEARGLLSLPPIPDGEKRLQSLNYVTADKAEIYQLGSESANNGEAE